MAFFLGKGLGKPVQYLSLLSLLVQTQVDDDEDRQEAADQEADKQGQGPLIDEFADVDADGNGHDGGDEACDRRTDPRDVSDGFHGHGAQVAEQESDSEELHGKEGKQNDHRGVGSVVEQDQVEGRDAEIADDRGVDDPLHPILQHQCPV